MAEHGGYGWKPDSADSRDYHFAPALDPATTALPPSVDLRGSNMPDVYDQGQLGSCTGNAWAALMQFERRRLGHTPDFVPARLFIYYEERVIENSVGQDSGAQLRDGAKALANNGAPPETDWPYDISTFTEAPTAQMTADAASHKAVAYGRVTQTAPQCKATLAGGNPFVFGFTVYASFESQAVAQSGIVPMPKSGEQVVGGHAVMACGYDDSAQMFLIRNSWGTGWGQNGYFQMPYAYLLDHHLASDLWRLTMVDTPS
jgi:C1A family cysteine protease